MLKLISIFLACCLKNYANAQDNIKKYVQENSIAITTIEPESTNYSDLEAIGNAIGNSKIVMLGEQDHGDAPAFLAKTRLIKYLHEKKGFNVLAFESDFFALNYGWDNLEKKENLIDSFLKKNIFPIWTYCDACHDLFYKTIPGTYKTGTPLIVTGFDNQMYLKYSSENLASKLDSVLKKLNLPITLTADYAITTLPLIDSMTKLSFVVKKHNDGFYNKFIEQLQIIKSELAAKIDSNNFWGLMIDNLIQTTIQFQNHKNYYKSNIARDFQMARNLKWLNTIKFPNDKIIVWAANYHIAKYADSTNDKRKLVSMSSFFTRDRVL